jgi:hypothetical protein
MLYHCCLDITRELDTDLHVARESLMLSICTPCLFCCLTMTGFSSRTNFSFHLHTAQHKETDLSVLLWSMIKRLRLQECEARSTNSKSAYSHDTIKVSLESKYDAKDALIKKYRRKVTTNDSASHTFSRHTSPSKKLK